MLALGHSGLTLGAAVLLAGALSGKRFSKANQNRDGESTSPSSEAPTSSSKVSRLDSLATRFDIRLLLIGSLLPDIIDKLVGQVLFRDTFSNGRIFSHTLLFLILLTVAGLYFYRRRSQTGLLALAFGTMTHLIFDQMWHVPQTLFWPLFGFALVKIDLSNWIPGMFLAMLTQPTVYVPELAGGAILAWFAWTLLRRKKIYAFIRYGRIR